MKHLLNLMDPDLQVWIAKAGGALAGSLISLAYVLPTNKRQAAIRFLTGVTAGIVFGLPVGVWISDTVRIDHGLGKVEIALMGAGFASLTIWTLLGVALRLAQHYFDGVDKCSAGTKQDKSHE